MRSDKYDDAREAKSQLRKAYSWEVFDGDTSIEARLADLGKTLNAVKQALIVVMQDIMDREESS